MGAKRVNHSERSHALLSASGASRWLNCTPSARLEDEHGERQTTSFAREGTLAHELSELYLSADVLKTLSEDEFKVQLEKVMDDEMFQDEMLDYVPIYTDYCASQLAEARTKYSNAFMEIEQRFDLREYIPGGFGTGDCCIVSDDTIEVIDLKYGKGVPVSAEWNPQLMIYALGLWLKHSMLYDFKRVRCTIVQPRLNNISSFELTIEELLNWAENELRPKAQLAYNGEGELSPGGWCRFCSVKNRCRALSEQQLEVAKHEFADPELLTDEEIADILQRAPRLVEWVDAIVAYAQAKAVDEGVQWPGFKLVEGISRRKWADEDKAADAILAQFPQLQEDDLFDMKLKSISVIEKMVGKKVFTEKLSSVVVKPQGKPTLVPLDDKRPAIGIEQAQIDFAE